MASNFALTQVEANALALYDQLQQLQLELALLRSQRGASQTAVHDLVGDQTRLLEAKATLALRNSIVESVVAVQPTLNAVHDAPLASPVERDLLPNIEQRDVAAIKTATMCRDLQTARGRLATLEVNNLDASRQNVKLASDVLQLARETQEQNPDVIEGGRFGNEIAVLEGQVKSSRHRWRVMKGATSAIVAASGVEWVRDERLREMVLDPLD
ncbi:centromere protein H (CENP-H)-domain-containing protein [Chaetomidium leptoderma]|uniref:Centromere protein H (CENP-H)-domain-containing protein n=1 Tax=Chaetomidium leptoderma TaxID=669021 RepID=A0AAN6VS68_9PEZI|nr:centromere protein H (CENP-H)-domain-containing protein [Chaetomidium leptoderma]